MKEIDVVAAILERNGKILLAQRPPHGDQPGLWEFPGGKMARRTRHRGRAFPLRGESHQAGQRTPDPSSCLACAALAR